jgi:quercetin dioxygenase-like cupin family protein
MPDKVRMIVTHVNDDGTSDLTEQVVEEVAQFDDKGNPTFKGNLLYGTADGVGSVGSAAPSENSFVPFFPGVAGHRFTVFSFLPESWQTSEGDSHAAAGDEQGEGEMEGLMDAFDPNRPGMHITDTIDYVYVISGEVNLVLDSGETLVKAGDVVVQRGTWHAWKNYTDTPCVVAAVLIGAERKDKS